MTRRFAFWTDGRPKGQGSMVIRGGRVHHPPGALRTWRSLVGWGAREAREAAGIRDPFAGPVAILAVFYLPRAAAPIRRAVDVPAVAPDLDKLIRAVGDGLTGFAYRDDCQVVAWTARKEYADDVQNLGVMVTVEEIGEALTDVEAVKRSSPLSRRPSEATPGARPKSGSTPAARPAPARRRPARANGGD